MKKISLLMSFPLFALTLAQNSGRIFQSVVKHPDFVEVRVNDGLYQIKFYTPQIAETAFIPNGQNLAEPSHAVVLRQKNVKFGIDENPDEIRINTEDLSVKITKKPFQISYYQNGKLLASEKAGYGAYKNGEINGHAQDFETLNFNLDPDEVLYGAGARAVGMNRRGKRYTLYNKAAYGYNESAELLNYTLPIVISSKKYLIHFDNAPIGYLDFDSKKDNTLTYETISGRKVYQIIAGKSWQDITENYTQLTGRQPLLPRWALGNFSSRFGYHTQDEVMKTAQKFRDEKIPADAVILDLYWFGKPIQGTLGNFEFDKDNFPQPQKMIDDLAKNNFETVLITEPFVLETSSHWKEAVDKKILGKKADGSAYSFDFYFGKGGIIDIYKPNGYAWFKDIYKNILSKNVSGIWGDLGEPEMHPSDLLHATGTADQVHNIYGHDWARLVQDAYKTYAPQKRPFILMRAGAAGSQRYGIIPWSGDVGRGWPALKHQSDISLQMGMQGIAYMGSDLGGFAGDKPDDELYTRWLQYGVFQPVFRPHAGEAVASEPVYRQENTKNLAKKSIELRYEMLPYNYNLTYENHLTGRPLMTPLFYEEPDNKTLYTYSAAYLWGRDFLISPVTQPGITVQDVYFPKSANWFDFYSGEKHPSGSTGSIPLAADHIPTFVRGGTVIPMTPLVQSTKDYNGNRLTLKYFSDENMPKSSTKIYNDDGKTVAADEAGEFEMMTFRAENNAKALVIALDDAAEKNFTYASKEISTEIYCNKKPKTVKFNHRNINFAYDKGVLKSSFRWNTAQTGLLEIRY